MSVRFLFLLASMFFTSFRLSIADGGINPPYQPNCPPLPRIVVNPGEGFSQKAGSLLIDWTPRGFNYVRRDSHENIYNYHSLFSPIHWSDHRPDVEEMFDTLNLGNYNVVRVFIDIGNSGDNRSDSIACPEGTICGDKETPHLNKSYLNNFAEFVKIATEHGIYVMPILSFIPQSDYYYQWIVEGAYPLIEGINKYYMDPGFICGKKFFVKDFVKALKKRIGENYLSSIFAYSIDNEIFFYLKSITYQDLKPFRPFPPDNSEAYVMTAANNIPYNMNLLGNEVFMGRQLCADDNVVFWANEVTKAVKEIDKKALVTAGTTGFAPMGWLNGPNGLNEPVEQLPHQGRLYPARTKALMNRSILDFVDWHYYETSRLPITTFQSQLENACEWHGINFSKPIIIGELGVKRTFSDEYPDCLSLASRYAVALQAYSTLFHFSGWLWWTYDPGLNDFDPDIWDSMAEPGLLDYPDFPAKMIFAVLSPTYRPDPAEYLWEFPLCAGEFH